MDRQTGGMSLEENSKPKRPARPPAQILFTIQPCRPAPPPPTALHIKTSSPPLEQPVTPAYIRVLSEETPAKQTGTPARPAPPVPRRPVLSRTERCYQSIEAESLNGSEKPAVTRNAGLSWNEVNANATENIPIYEDVLPNENEDGTSTPDPLPAPPRPPTRPHPLTPPRPPVTKPRRPFLSQSVTEEPVEHLYEYIADVIPDSVLEDECDNGERDVCSVDRKPGTPHPLRSWSEQSSVDGDSSAKELDILLEWWRSVEGWETLTVGHHGQESESKMLMLVVHRVKMAMRLFQLLVFQRGRILLNHITELHCTADSVSRVGKNTRIAGITGGTTGAVGAAAVVAGLALAPFTFGASMVAAGIGVGVAAAGGVTGASAAITNKVKSSQVRSKLERILRNCRIHLENIVACLEFVEVGMEQLRHRNYSKLKHLDSCALKIIKMAQEIDSFYSTDAISRCSCILQGFASGLDSYFTEEDQLKLKRDSENQFAEKIREVADKLKESMDELILVKNQFRSIVDSV
ncbi:uncharacterized protein LOC103032771 isoform X1 [Astyanax mexicanus]|uniref:uncharacterized protein LOC103032771 isoform X1 n=1 Tax=Astyanax mexicanus TaxID=7994 RepID=UPI0020CB16B0|nr:uncharacterized protein LOC103032771 isoform X1 [Astyanax mexicanus]